MKKPQKEIGIGSIRVAMYNRDHFVVKNEDGSIDIFRRPSARTTDAALLEKTQQALENINKANERFWRQRTTNGDQK